MEATLLSFHFNHLKRLEEKQFTPQGLINHAIAKTY